MNNLCGKDVFKGGSQFSTHVLHLQLLGIEESLPRYKLVYV